MHTRESLRKEYEETKQKKMVEGKKQGEIKEFVQVIKERFRINEEVKNFELKVHFDGEDGIEVTTKHIV